MSRPMTLALVLCCLSPQARADASPPAAGAVSIPQTRGPAKAPHPRRAKAATRVTAPSAVEPIVGGAGTAAQPRGEAATGRGDAEAWSLTPKWNASNGGASAAYGTRALVNELHSNPAETTGYGAGAQVDFHF